MAVDVLIKSKQLFKKNLKMEQVILHHMRYGMMNDFYRLNENVIGENTVVFDSNLIGRGYEVCLKKGEVVLRMPLPTSENDIRLFYKYIDEICKMMKTKQFLRDGENASLDNVDQYIKNDIRASRDALISMGEKVTSGEYDNMCILGALNPITLGKKEIEQIDGSVENFGAILHRLQSLDVYYASPGIYKKKDGSYFGVYVLTEEIPTVLPNEAKLLMDDETIKIESWYSGFVIGGKVAGTILYNTLLEQIDKNKYYDCAHFIGTLKGDDMKKILDQYRVEF